MKPSRREALGGLGGEGWITQAPSALNFQLQNFPDGLCSSCTSLINALDKYPYWCLSFMNL